ncbi:septum formation family protein [Microbacterium sp. No. 7]|uniref:septum formation family protein n=1 Tax=Microbacterium sp. No. 7 TaxID=1714373 RepID=UPI0006D213E4|nr:septum formation family protein [Microbacterium sp. No. 7]ALJ20088.1 hypothetical protein AOA12_09265 [Microbacterium sp. No. 7]
MKTSRPLPLLIATTAIAVATVPLAGCGSAFDLLEAAASGGPADTETRDAETGEIVEGGTTDVFTIRVGDCLNDPTTDGEVYEVTTVPCGEPHDYEVYHHAELADGEYPADLDEQADALCMAAFADFVGVPFEESMLGFTYYTPTVQSWVQGGDRAVDCLVYDQALTTGTLAGTAR